MALTKDDVRQILLAVCDRVIREEAWFCRLDSVVGDGDHGVTMTRGFRAVKEALRDDMGVKELLETAGKLDGLNQAINGQAPAKDTPLPVNMKKVLDKLEALKKAAGLRL